MYDDEAGLEPSGAPRCRRVRWMVAAVALAASSCSDGESAAPPAPVERAGVQELTVAVGEDEFLRGGSTAANLGLLTNGLNPGIFETLTVLTPSFGLRPGLAVRWEASSPTTWRFELRPDVRFHDGSPFTADAVVESLQRVTGGTGDPGSGGVPLHGSRPRGLEPDSASAVEDLVVEIELSEPNLRLAEQLSSPRAAVLAPGTLAGNGTSDEMTPTGTGPFRFLAYRPEVELAVAANEDYWDGPPGLDAMTFVFGAEEDASRLLATGDVDAVGYVAAELLANVSGGLDRRVRSTPAESALLLLNRGGIDEWDLLGEDAVRQAVALALDRPAVAETAWPDAGEPNDSLIPPAVLGGAAEEVRPASQDAEAAEALLEEAGWELGTDGVRERDGRRLELDVLLRRPTDGLPDAAAVIAGQLAAVGIATTSIVDQPFPDPLASAALAGDPTPLQRVNAGTFDLFVDLRTQDDANPCALCRFFSIRPGGELTVAGVVGGGDAADALYDQVHSAPSIDSARRLAADLMQVVVTDEVVALPLATLSNVWLLSSRVEGFQAAAIGGTQTWHSVFLAR